MLQLPLFDSRYAEMYARVPTLNEIQGNPPPARLPVANGADTSATTVISRKKRIMWDVLGLLGLLIIVFVFYMLVNPPTLYFQANDPSLSYPYISSKVSSVLVALLSIILPIAVVIIFHIFLAWDKYDLYAGIYGAVLAYLIALLITSTLWHFVGGLRPHFFSICDLDKTKLSVTRLYYTKDDCLNKGSFTQDTFHGFPSGHASTAFAGCVFTSAYLASHLRLYRNGNLFKVLVVALPWICAIWLAASRIVDHHHSPFQVVAGIIIGILSALFAYKLVYVNGFFLGHGKWAHIPYVYYDM